MRHAMHAFWLRLRNWWEEPKYVLGGTGTFFARLPMNRDIATWALMRLQQTSPNLGPRWLVRKEP